MRCRKSKNSSRRGFLKMAVGSTVVALGCQTLKGAFEGSIGTVEEPSLWDSVENTHLAPIDPVSQARAGIEGYMVKAPQRLPGPEGYFRATFRSWILPPKFGHDRWDWGDCTARAVLAWISLREMTGDTTTGLEVEQGQRRLLLSILHPETGLVYEPELSDRKKGRYHYHIWDQSRTLHALVRWYQTSPQDRGTIEPLITRMINGLDRYATIRGTDPTWGPYAGWQSDEYTDYKPGAQVGWVNMRAGICIEPLVMYAEPTGDARVLDLAIRFANCALGGHECDPVPADAPRRPELSGIPANRDFVFGDDGSFTGHFHTKSSTLIGIVKLARYLGTHGHLEEAKHYLGRVRQIYDWIFEPNNSNRGSRIGWFPEQLFPNTSRVVCETCCQADMSELAAAMASCCTLAPEFHAWANLYDDAEALSVNTAARSQFRITPEYEKLLAKIPGKELTTALETARRFEGGWTAKFYPDDLVFIENDGSLQILGWGCCAYSGFRALYSGWQAALGYNHGTLRINFLLRRQSPRGVVETKVPLTGEATVELRQDARVLMRVPSWLKPDQLKLAVAGRVFNPPTQLDNTGHYLDLDRIPRGTKIEARFPILERESREKIGGNNQGGNNREAGYCNPKDKIEYTIRWRGNYVAQIRPRGVRLPIFPG